MRKFLGLAAAALMVVGLAAVRAQSDCPSLPYQCSFYKTCSALTWCEESIGCNAYQPNRQMSKNYYIRRCTYNGSEVLCSSCTGPVLTGTCCTTVTTPPSCPTGSTCQ